MWTLSKLRGLGLIWLYSTFITKSYTLSEPDNDISVAVNGLWKDKPLEVPAVDSFAPKTDTGAVYYGLLQGAEE